MRKYILPLVILFILTNAFFINGKAFLEKKGFDPAALIIGNLVLFAAGLLSFFIVQKGITGKNPAAFVRRVYGGFIGKLMVILAGLMVYMVTAPVNKPAIMVLMGLYVLYTVAEVRGLMLLNKAQKKNA
jgi:hypothetical protein